MPAHAQSLHPRSLDFVVIGAQKAGTTTLFEHLRSHPSLYLPPSKEAAYFNRPDLWHNGVGTYLDEFFGAAPAKALWGTVTPGYMCDADVPRRLRTAFPEVKLVAILREPFERARSQFRMATRRGIEDRPLGAALELQLRPERLTAARSSRDETATYVAWSEYGRILGGFLEHFPPEQLLVLTTEDLGADPAAVVRSVHRFLGVPHVAPPSLGERHLVGSARARLPGLQQRMERSWLRHPWHLLPRRHRDLIFHRFDRWNIKPARPGEGGEQVDDAVRDAVVAHVEEDVAGLLRRFGVRATWGRTVAPATTCPAPVRDAG